MNKLPTLTLAALLMAPLAGLHAAESAPVPATLQAAYGRWFELGVAIEPKMTEAEQALLRDQFSNVTSQNCLKPAMTEPTEGAFTFEKGDALPARFRPASGSKAKSRR